MALMASTGKRVFFKSGTPLHSGDDFN